MGKQEGKNPTKAIHIHTNHVLVEWEFVWELIQCGQYEIIKQQRDAW